MLYIYCSIQAGETKRATGTPHRHRHPASLGRAKARLHAGRAFMLGRHLLSPPRSSVTTNENGTKKMTERPPRLGVPARAPRPPPGRAARPPRPRWCVWASAAPPSRLTPLCVIQGIPTADSRLAVADGSAARGSNVFVVFPKPPPSHKRLERSIQAPEARAGLSPNASWLCFSL